MFRITSIKLSICVYHENEENLEESLNKIKSQIDTKTEIISINKNEDILKQTKGQYILLTDSQNIENINIKNITSIQDEDILLNTDKTTSTTITHTDNAKKIFSNPKNNMNIYKTEFLKNNSIQIPSNHKSYENILFYYKTIFLANKITTKNIFQKITHDDSIETLILNDYKYTYSDEKTYTINSEELFKTFENLLTFFKQNNLYNLNKFYILNYTFNILRKTYKLNQENKEDYFNKLKIFIRHMSQHNTDLVLNLKSKNLRFYRIIQEVNTIKELDLLLKNDEYEKENFITHHQLDKFRTLIIDLKNVDSEDNMLEMVEFPQDNKSKFILDKFRDSEGSGIRIISFNNKLNFKIRCINKGKLNVYVRGSDIKDKKARRIPITIDLKRFQLCEEALIEENKVITYEKPLKYTKDVEDQEIIDIQAEWSTVSNQSIYHFQDTINSALMPFDTIRFDIKNVGNSDNTIEVIKNTDENASEYAPEWFTDKNGIGKVIRSSNEHIHFQIQCIKTGTLKIFLRTLDLRDKNRQRIPVKVDLEQLIVNNNTLVDENILISHDKPYEITRNVKDGEIIDVIAHWSPISSKSTYFESTTIRSDLLPFTTARFDIKNKGKSDNCIEIYSIDDYGAKIYSPGSFRNQYGLGQVIESAKGKIKFKIKCINAGTLELFIRAINFMDTQASRIPLKIDIKRLIINGDIIIDENKLVSHDNPYTYTKQVNDGEIVTISAEWNPISRKSTYFESSNIRNDLLPFTTLHFDIKNRGDKENKTKVVSYDDDNIINYTPGWFTDETGEGRIIESAKGKLNLHLKCIQKGELTLSLKTMNFKDKSGHRMPLNIDIKSLTINNKILIEENTLISYEKPYEYTKQVVDGEIINIKVEWAPLSVNSQYSD